jgi:ribulose-5-phosphate 4-epimerase/fuculose-1-phosphate aldolase
VRLGALRGEIVDVLRRLEAGGLVTGTSGNVSVRDSQTGLIAVSPTSIPYDRMRPEDVSVVDDEGELIEGAAPSVELPMHLTIHAGRPEAAAVVHTHSPYATALAAVLDEIPVVLAEQAAAVGGPILVVPYAPTGERAMGEAVLSAGDAWAAIVRSHGPVCLGRSLGEALRCAFAVEEAAHVYAVARLHGEPALLPPDELERLSRLRLRPRARGTAPARRRRS